MKRIFAAAAAAAAGLTLGLGAAANASPVYGDSQVTASHQRVDAITAIDAAASWAPCSLTLCPATSSFTSPTFIGNGITFIPVPSVIHGQLTAHDANGNSIPNTGALAWSIVSETNIPAGVLIGINPVSGLLTVQPPTGPVIANNNQEITVVVKVTDGAATAFETLTGQPVVFSGLGGGGFTCPESDTCISGINVTAVTDDVTLAGVNDNVTDAVDFSSTPPGAPLTLANAPDGAALNGTHLVATDARPDTYSGLAVTATDAAGATAVDTFSVEIDGAVAGSTTPRLSGGHAVCVQGHSAREDVFYVQSGSPSWDHFTIVGPGAINGHQGWVDGQLGLNEAVYGGLEPHHGYTVYYQPVTGQGSTTPVPGSHWGYVYFVSGQGC